MKSLFVFSTVVVWVLVGCHSLTAQLRFIPSGSLSPQAKTQDELDEYGLVFESRSPNETLRLANQFYKNYPASEFRLYAIIQEMYAYESMNNYEGTVATGRAGLKISPRNIDVLTTLANALADHLPPNRQLRERLLEEAEADASEAQREIEKLVRPFSVPRSQFGKEKREAQAAIASVFGLIALQHDNFATAISKYETAASLTSEPRGGDYYRLGVAYVMNGQYEKGLQRLEQAVTLGPPLITTLAQQQITELRKVHRLPD
jgi:tetratricopeptide (TPR) repeat protein